MVGAEGTPEYGVSFRAAAERWKDAAGRAQARTTVIGLAPAGGPPDRRKLEEAIAQAVGTAGNPLWLVLIGHGTFDGRTARFNLRGPDVASDELAAWLKPARRPLVIVNGASASAPFLKPLTGTDRVILTATKSGTEQNATRFGGFLAEAIADPAADLDHPEPSSPSPPGLRDEPDGQRPRPDLRRRLESAVVPVPHGDDVRRADGQRDLPDGRSGGLAAHYYRDQLHRQRSAAAHERHDREANAPIVRLTRPRPSS